MRHLNDLCDLKVPFLFCARPRKEIIYRGTMNCIKVFDEHKRLFDEALKADIKLLCHPSNPDNIVVIQNTETFELERMKTSLSLANTDEPRQNIRYLITFSTGKIFRNRRKNKLSMGKMSGRLLFGHRSYCHGKKLSKISPT